MRPIPIIILTYNKFDLAYRCIDMVRKNTTLPHKIIVVDNGSDNPFIYRFADEIIRLEKNVGFTAGMNEGIKKCKLNYDYIVLLSNDTEVTPGWLESLIETAKTDEKIGIVGAKEIDENGGVTAFGGADIFGGHCVKGEVKIDENENVTQVPELLSQTMSSIRDVKHCMFFAILITRKLVETIGLMDDRFVIWCSDNDYCATALTRGFRVVVDPNCRIVHKQGSTVISETGKLNGDKKQFLYKWFGGLANSLFDGFPVDDEKKIYIKCGMVFKDKEGKSIPPENTGLDMGDVLK